MSGCFRPRSCFSLAPLFGLLLAGFFGCAAGGKRPVQIMEPTPTLTTAAPTAAPVVEEVFPVMLGIDVLEADGFAVLKGKRVGLVTHPAGVNRRGESTIEVLRRAPDVQLVALYAGEHGLYNDTRAEIPIKDGIDPHTGLPVYSLYGTYRKPTPAMLRGLDALVIDLQDIGTRSYTFASTMLYAMAACFENDIECVVLDRPNPLGGLKVDGPPLDAEWKSFVGAFRAPYVHGLTIGELARWAKEAPRVLWVPNAIDVADDLREAGKLTIVPMRGWQRWMRWPETGLTFVPTSTYIRDFAACVGYPMTGLGTYLGSFSHGIGTNYPFRGIAHPKANLATLERELNALRLPGLAFRRVDGTDRKGQPAPGLYIEVTDWDAWNPTELNFHMMRLTCRLEGRNPFAAATAAQVNGFIKHVGSQEFFEAIKRDGEKVDLDSFLLRWRESARIYQQLSRRYWLYP
jgi:uncharacterized protein YbbC (DUF1343 family)